MHAGGPMAIATGGFTVGRLVGCVCFGDDAGRFGADWLCAGAAVIGADSAGLERSLVGWSDGTTVNALVACGAGAPRPLWATRCTGPGSEPV
jgi:hypothetical protein